MNAPQWICASGMAVALSACGEPLPIRREVLSLAHSDKSVTAMIVEEKFSEGDVTYRLHLSTSHTSEAARWMAPVSVIKGLQGASLNWRERVLTVSYTAGEVVIAHGLWRDPQSSRGSAAYQVEIQLVPLCEKNASSFFQDYAVSPAPGAGTATPSCT